MGNYWYGKKELIKDVIINFSGDILKEGNYQFSLSETDSIIINFHKVLGRGGFGTVFSGFRTILLPDGTKKSKKSVLKILNNIDCKKRSLKEIENENQEILIQYILSEHSSYIPKISLNRITIQDTWEKHCYYGIVSDQIEINLDNILDKFLADVTESNAIIFYNLVLEIISSVEHQIKELFDNHRFKHNDLHTGNVMFKDNHHPIFIDFGASVINDQKLIIEPKLENIDSFFGEIDNQLKKELFYLFKEYPSSDFYLYLFDLLSNIYLSISNAIDVEQRRSSSSDKQRILQTLTKLINQKLDDRFKYSEMNVKDEKIYMNGKFIEVHGVEISSSNEILYFSGVYKEMVKILKEHGTIENMISSYPNLWKCRYLGLFYATHLE